MAIFDNELIDNKIGDTRLNSPVAPLGSPILREVNTSMGGFEDFASGPAQTGMTLDELSKIQGGKSSGFGSFSMVPKSELISNQRYNIYERDKDLENIYGLQQGWASQLANGVIKMAATGIGTFAQSFATVPNTISAIKNGKLADLSGDPNGYEGNIDNWLKNIEDIFPNYYTRKEKEHPYLAALPFAPGSANFWGDKVIKNLGFTVGAIGGALAQDAMIGFATGAVGEIPLVANQVGKASLWLNKLFAGTNDLEKTLALARGAGVAGEDLLNIKRLGELAAATKLNSGFRYGMNLYGSARTEAGVEARDGYRQVKEELLKQYKLEHLGEEPIGEDAAQIESYATDAMNTRFGINMAILTASNAIQFDNLFKSFSNAGKGITGGLTKELEEAGKIGLKEGSIDVFEKKAAETISGRVWNAVRPKMANILTEGVYEEGGQYAAEKGTYDYYTRKYKDPNRRENADSWNTLNETISSTFTGLKDQFGTSEGLENMFVGAFSAMITGGIMGKMDSVKGRGADARLQTSINTLNRYGLTGILSDGYGNTLNSMGIAKDMEAAAKSGNVFQYKNFKHDMFFNFVQSRIPSGMHDVTIEQLKLLKDLPKEEFEKTFGMDFSSSNKSTVSDYVDALIANANEIKKTTDSIDSTFKNPFKSYVNPTTGTEEEVSNRNFDTFESYKRELSWLASVGPDTKNRLDSIQQSLMKINPLLTNGLVATLTDSDSLKDLSKSYEEKANQLDKTITEVTSPEDKRNIKEQVKALRTASEKVNLALKNGYDQKTFDYLLNFELNNQDATASRVVGPEWASDISTYGVDVNKLNFRKKRTADLFDKLSDKEGFEKFFKQADDMASGEAPIPTQEAEVVPEEKLKSQFVNKAGQKEDFDINREYSIPTAKKSSIDKIADDRWQLTAPNGDITFHSSKEKAEAAAKDIDSDFAALSKVKVLAVNEDGTIKVEDADGNIQNIDPKLLSGYDKIETEQEKAQKFAEQVEKEQKDIENKSGEVATQNSGVDVELPPTEGKLKAADKLFISTISASEENEVDVKPHQIRSRVFLNNVKNFPNRANVKLILVTPNQEESLGLKGLAELSGSSDVSVDNGLVAAVYVLQENGKTFFISQDGKNIGEVGQPVDMQQVVFSTMPTTDLYYNIVDKKTGKRLPRFRANQEAEATLQSKAWTIKRAELFEAPTGSFTVYDFNVSRGIPVETKSADGKKERNPIGDNLIPENKIATQQDLIIINTTGTISHNGENLSFPKGNLVLQYADTLQFINNRTFTQNEAQAIYEILKRVSESVKNGYKINRIYSTFLQNVLFWRSKTGTSSANQLFIDVKNMDLYIGQTKYDITDVANKEKEIIDQLKNTFNSVNKDTLTKSFSEPFTEFYMKDGELVSNEWTNYQSYLLSSKYPNGQARSINDTPLSTSVTKPTPDIVPYNYKQKYATLQGLELPVQQVVKAAPVAAPVAPTSEYKIGEYDVNGKENTITLKDPIGDIKFTATIDADGNVNVTATSSARTEAIAKDEEAIAPYINALKGANKFDATKTNEQLLLDFISLNIAARLQKIKEEQAPVASVVTPIATAATFTPTTPYGTPTGELITTAVSDIEKMYPASAILIKEFRAEGNNELLQGEDYENQLQRIEKTITSGIKNGLSKEQIMQMLIANGHAINFGNDTISVINFIQNRIDGKESRLFSQFAKNTKEVAAPKNFKGTKPPSNSEFRKTGVGEVERMTEAEIELFKQWAAENVPNIPYEVLDNIINTHDGEKAWGVFENGVAKFYRSAARGTEYHEIFEGIFKGMLSKGQQQDLLDEFKSKKGTFVDRQSGKKIAYDEATDQQAKERIADDFADFRLGKLPARSLGEKILKFFKSIIEFVKSFVNKPSLKTELFKAIDTGKFKEQTLSESVINEAAEYRTIAGLTEQQTNDFVQDMTARFFQNVFGNNLSLFNPENLTSPEIFNNIKTAYAEEGKLDILGENAWNQLVKRTQEFLRTFKIEFDENSAITINDESVNKNDYAAETFSTDWKKTSSFPIKLVLGTLTETEATNQQNASSLSLPAQKLSNLINGYKLLNFSRTFATVLDKLANTTNVTKAVDKLIDLAKFDSNYVRLFTRLGGDRNTVTIDFSKFEAQDWRLFVNFYQTFTKQKPDALIQYMNNGEVYTAPANLFTIIKQTQNGWVENIKQLSGDEYSLIKYNRQTKTYQVEDISKEPIKTVPDQIAFISKLGIEFPIEVYNKLKTNEKKRFGDAVSAIRSYLSQANDIVSVDSKTLGINGPLSTLAELLVKVTNPNQDSTYFGVEGQRINAFSENNAPSVLENEFNETSTLEELVAARPELKDVFSANGVTFKKGGLFFDENGVRIKSLKVSYIQGTKDIDNDKGKTTSKLTLGDRFTQEINQNVHGNYYVLIPADGSTEWMMNLGNNIRFVDVDGGKAWNKIYGIFKGYLLDDFAIALDADNRKQLRNVGAKAKELRFFKEILSEKLLEKANALITNNATQEQINDFISENIEAINDSIKALVENTVTETKNILENNNQIIRVSETEFTYPNLDDNFAKKEKLNKYKLSEKEVNDILTFTNTNYIIANIEYHKILFGDPYQFAIKNGNLDETKRIKSFLSPRRTTFDSAEYNTWLNQNLNKDVVPGDPGYHQFKSYTNTITVQDVEVMGTLLGKTNEADAASWIMDGTYREVKLKNGQWSDEAENWYQWQMAYTRNALANKGEYSYTNKDLQKADLKTLATPEPKYTIEVLKPIVSGNKFNKDAFDLVLDKFSQMPVFYSMVEGKNLESLYKKMMKENVGYAIMESGRKVGAEKLHKLYNQDGSFNEDAFNNNIQVPWKAYGIQVENSFEKEKQQTRGSQLTKLSSLDLFDNGVASEAAQKEYTRNKTILDLLHQEGYRTLLEKLGIEDLGDSFRVINNKAVSETLEYEMLRRELSDNAKDTVQLDENGEFRIPFEASPAYLQITNILYSMVDKAITSPKMNGMSAVQVPVTLWENAKAGRSIAIKTDKGYKKLSKAEYEELSDEDKKKVVLTDDTLKFYTKKDPYCEILLPYWFKEKLNKKKFPNDKALLDYLNSTEEGKSILTGIGFRIPTQSLSSTEVFRVKGFLPKSMGDTVIVPSEITTKAGSDFDIDKLNTYLKSIYIDKNGDIRLVKYKGSEQATKEFYSNVFDEKLEKKKLNKAELFEAVDILNYGLDDPKNLVERYSDLLDVLLEGVDPVEYSNKLMQELEKLGDKNLQQSLKDKFVKDMYKRSLENEYYDSLEKLITLPENFERLIAPVGDAGLKGISNTIDVLSGQDENKIKNRLLNRNYMTTLRNSFVTAKKWVGIAAVNITNHSLTQKAQVYIDPARFFSEFDRKFLKDGSIVLPHNTVTIGNNTYTSISGVKDVNGDYISEGLSGYATAFVDVAKDPYIMKIIKSDNVVGTFMFLQRIGVPIKTAALFMNQPIIVQYLKYLDSINSKGLFNTDNLAFIATQFIATGKEINDAQIDLNMLAGNISTFHEKGYFKNSEDNAVQHAVLKEFLKYAKMAEYSFKMTQAINYDTTKFSSGAALYRKQLKTQKALDTNIFSGIQDVLDASFIGEQSNILDKTMDAMGAILKLERDEFTAITNRVLKPYANNDFLSNADFDTIASKIKASFLDYIVQTKTGINSDIETLMVNAAESVATQLVKAKQDHPEIKILNDFEVVSSKRVDGGAKSIKLKVNLKDAYDENMYTGMMRELRDNPDVRDLYYDIVILSILQGTYQSAISINNIIPIEDYSKIIKPVIDTLVANPSLDAFTQGSFQKNNFKYEDVFPIFYPKFLAASEDPIAEQTNQFGDHIADVYQYFSPSFPNIEALNLESTDRKILTINEAFYSSIVGNDFIKVPRVVVDRKTGETIDMITGQTITRKDFAVRKAKGDFSLQDVFGYQKVKYSNGQSLITLDKKGNNVYIYKLVNLYGDGNLVSEYYENNKPSVLNNGTIKIDNEIPDADIINYYGGEITEEVLPLPSVELITFDQIEEFTPERKQEILSNFAAKHKMTEQQAKDYINQALQKNKESVINKLKECY